MKRELDMAKEMASALESLDKLKSKLTRKECEQAWAVVALRERELAELVTNIEHKTKSRPKFAKKLTLAKVFRET